MKLTIPNKLILTKFSAAAAANDLVTPAIEGAENPLTSFAKIAWLEEVLKVAKTRLKDEALREAEKYEQKEFTVCNGVKVAIREVGVKYDYSRDKEWCDLKDNIDGLVALQKGREETLKRMNLAPRTSTTSVVLTFPNK